jgi:ribonuclease HII
VALASMIAKLGRELLMRRFNAYWGERFNELNGRAIHPTAGYATDARRWLEEVGDDVLGRVDREALIRTA